MALQGWQSPRVYQNFLLIKVSYQVVEGNTIGIVYEAQLKLTFIISLSYSHTTRKPLKTQHFVVLYELLVRKTTAFVLLVFSL